MNLISYLIISELSLIGFYLVWRFLLLKSDAHRANRWWLLAGMLVAGIFPLLSVTSFYSAPIAPSITLPEVVVALSDKGAAPDRPVGFNWFLLIYAVYAIGAVIAGIRLFSSLRKIMSIKSKSIELDRGVFEVAQSKATEAFSFLRWIFIPKKSDEHTRNTLLLHESVHSRELHSIDILLMQVWKAIHWYSPLTALYDKAIRDTHEFIVDDEMMRLHIDKEQYAKTLIRAHQSELQIGLVHSFSDKSSIKNRLKMMYKTKSKLGKFLQLLAIPFFIATVLIACTKVEGSDPVVMAQEEVLKVAEVMPEFPGGMDSFMEYMMEHIKYPESQKESGISGQVFVSFIVGKNGEVRDAKVVKSLNEDFDQAALQVVADMPHWTPGQNDGKNVAVQMTLPVSYVMEAE